MTKIINYSLHFLRQLGTISDGLLTILCLLRKARVHPREIMAQSVVFISNILLPIILIGIALGTVIGIQLTPEFAKNGIESQIGILSALSMTRELMPVIGSLMIATQYGTGLTAELANMKITEQIDALKIFKVSPIGYLVVPRFLSLILFAPLVIWFGALVGIISTYVFSWLVEDISLQGFLRSIQEFLLMKDLLLCLFKASFFGALIVTISSGIGLATEGGAKEVGKATTKSVIINFLTIIISDYIISSIFI
jgi:phospholipid/cholesterol/gamma-HCH transport system permease protein